MIKLTVDPDTSSLEQTFEKNSLTIGSAAQGECDLVLTENIPDDFLIEIVENTDQTYSLINKSETSPITLNGQECEEGAIESGDRIACGDVTILIDTLGFSGLGEALEGMDQDQDQDQDQHQDPSDPEEDFDIDAELEKLDSLFSDEALGLDEIDKSLELSDEDIDALVEEVEEIEQEASVAEEQPPEEQQEIEWEEPLEEAEEEAEEAEQEDSESLILEFHDEQVDEELQELIDQKRDPDGEISAGDDEDDWDRPEQDLIEDEQFSDDEEKGEGDEDELLSEQTQTQAQGSFIKKLLCAAIVLFAALGVPYLIGVSYLRSQNAEYELTTARALADIAMAFTHANMQYGSAYHNQWSNPEFIEDNLNAVLSEPYRNASFSDARTTTNTSKSFLDPSYELKIYNQTRPDKFLVLAKPKKGWRQTLAPKAGFLVCSDGMEVRREFSPKIWDGIFPESLQSENIDIDIDAKEIQELIERTDVVRLQSLNANSTTAGFSVPKDLVYLQSDAKSVIYNAPRYYPFTDGILQKIASYGTGSLSKREKAVLKHSIDQLSKLPHLVLYSSQDIEMAQQARDALSHHLPLEPRFLLGYVTLDEKSKMIVHADILLEKSPLSYFQQEDPSSIVQQENSSADLLESLDTTHPLFVTLMELSSQRQNALEEIGEQITSLLHQHNHKEAPEFYEKHQDLLAAYTKVSRECATKIARVLENLYQDYVAEDPDQNLSIYLASVQATELENLLPQKLRRVQQSDAAAKEEDSLSFEGIIENVKMASTLEDLDKWVAQGAHFLHAEGGGGSEMTLDQQNRLKTEVLQKVGGLLLSPDSTLAKQNFQEKNRLLLTRILNDASISEEEERDFYLKEFDLLMEKFKNVSQQTAGEMQELDQQVTRIPLTAATSSPEEQQESYGRLGQQILVQERGNPPSNRRDKKLLEAIGLLSQDTNDNRALWTDILEARRLITETPKQDILAIIASDEGLSSSQHSLIATIRGDFGKYIEEKQAVALAKNQEQREAQSVHFKQTQRDQLQRVIVSSRAIQREGGRLVKRFDDYLVRVEELLRDYQTAQQQGFFVSDQRYHTNTMGKIKRKFFAIKDLGKKIKKASRELAQASQQHQRMAKEELAALDAADSALASSITPKGVAKLQQKHNRINYPNIIAENFGSDLREVLDISF